MVCTQVLVSTTSGTSPPASMAVPSRCRTTLALPATRARSATFCASSPEAPSGSAASPSTAPELKAPMTWWAGSAPAGSGALSPSTSAAYAEGRRRTVWVALLIRMSRGPRAATCSARATAWAGSRRSMPTTSRRCIQSPESSIALKRRMASLGKRVVIVVWAPSRSSLSAMYMPILARPPVSSARLPVRSARASRRARFSAAQSWQSWW